MADWVERGGRIFLRRNQAELDPHSKRTRYVEVQIDNENYQELQRLAGELQAKWNRRVTIDEVITHLCKQFEQAGVVEPHQE